MPIIVNNEIKIPCYESIVRKNNTPFAALRGAKFAKTILLKRLIFMISTWGTIGLTASDAVRID